MLVSGVDEACESPSAILNEGRHPPFCSASVNEDDGSATLTTWSSAYLRML